MLLTVGVLLWAVIHLFVAVAPDARKSMIGKIGLNPYKGLFSLALVGALVLIVMGWKTMTPAALYHPPLALRHLAMALMPVAIILFMSARAPTDIKRLIRHPQLTGVKLWAVLHLLANGEQRSVILFGGLLIWAVLEVILINRRDGAWNKPQPFGAMKTGISALIGLAATALLAWAHPWFAGMPLF